eukprot:88591_1
MCKLLFLFTFVGCAIATDIFCSKQTPCQNQMIDCDEGDVCNVYCVGGQGSGDIHSWGVCSQSIFNASHLIGGSFYLYSSEHNVPQAKVYCPQDGDCNIRCNWDKTTDKFG